MATVGVKGLRMAIIDPVKGTVLTGDDGLNESGIYEVFGKEAQGVTQANITGLAPSVTKIWGNNILQDQSVGKAQPSVAATFNNLPHAIMEKALGHESDGKGGFLDNANGVLPHIALDIVSQDLAGSDVHFCFYDGNFTMGDKTVQTDNENESRDTDNLTYNPVAGANGHLMKTFYASEEGYDEKTMLDEIFPTASKA
ncbi:phage tail protein [uncultured Secundilactobacillus sp.]|uniref:phage tail protein n=1 Tax=uncultured Secundilactobacillus sp. TaxID=2813935 RepID=UPI00258D39C8|nr:phage tail protein [uncultured Secundilactobacillus sp.]